MINADAISCNCGRVFRMFADWDAHRDDCAHYE